MVAEMTCYTYLGHIRNPRIYAVPPNYAVFTRFYFHPKNRVKWGEYCTTVIPPYFADFGMKKSGLKNREIGGTAK